MPTPGTFQKRSGTEDAVLIGTKAARDFVLPRKPTPFAAPSRAQVGIAANPDPA